ncbi:MAG: glycoside hydrolase family 16 protein [Firmicutes bacterium]|nr:glycoside hydrolase family 16 protein [Bacillota bacterium]
MVKNDFLIDSAACTFFDDFSSGIIDRTKWTFHTGDGSKYDCGGGWGNGERQRYHKENASIVDGNLRLTAYKADKRRYTSAKLVTWDTAPDGKRLFSQTYGRFEARLRLSKAVEGLWPAFWMMPTESVYGIWPSSGEIDIMEMRGRFARKAFAALHFAPTGSRVCCAACNNPKNRLGFDITDFHIYTCDWEPGRISFYIDYDLLYSMEKDGTVIFGDGVRIAGRRTRWNTDFLSDSNAPFDKNFYLTLNLAVGGTFDGGKTPPDSAFETDPPYLEVDFVRAFSLSDMQKFLKGEKHNG